MEMGKIGIISKVFFDTCVEDEKWVYLTTIIDVTDSWQKIYPNRKPTRTFYEVRYRLLEPGKRFTCSALYLGDVVIPDSLVSNGNDHKMTHENIERWKYHKILLTTNDKTEISYLHEKCLRFFTWFDKV